MLKVCKTKHNYIIVVNYHKGKVEVDKRDMVHIVHGVHYQCDLIHIDVFNKHYTPVTDFDKSKDIKYYYDLVNKGKL